MPVYSGSRHSASGNLKKQRRTNSVLGSATCLLLAVVSLSSLLWRNLSFVQPAGHLRTGLHSRSDFLKLQPVASPLPVQQLTVAKASSSAALKGSPIQPLGAYVLVAPKAAESSKSGIVFTKASQELPTEGVVVAVGPGNRDEASDTPENMWVSVGQTVKFTSFGAEPVNWGEEEEWLLVRQSSVILEYSEDSPTPNNVKLPPGKLLLQLVEVESQTAGGIITSQASQASDLSGTIVALSDDLQKDPHLAIGKKVKCRPTREAYEVKMADGSNCMQVDLKDAVAVWSE